MPYFLIGVYNMNRRATCDHIIEANSTGTLTNGDVVSLLPYYIHQIEIQLASDTYDPVWKWFLENVPNLVQYDTQTYKCIFTIKIDMCDSTQEEKDLIVSFRNRMRRIIMLNHLIIDVCKRRIKYGIDEVVLDHVCASLANIFPKHDPTKCKRCIARSRRLKK